MNEIWAIVGIFLLSFACFVVTYLKGHADGEKRIRRQWQEWAEKTIWDYTGEK